MSDGLSQVLPGFGPPGQEPPGQHPPIGRRGQRDRKRRRKKKRRSIVALLIALLLVGGAVVGAYYGLAPLVHKLSEPDDYTGTGTTPVTVKVPIGASGQRIAGVLASAGVVKTQQAFLDAWNADPARSGQVQPGTYTLKKQMSAASALALMLSNSSLITHTVTITEGMRAADVYTLLAKRLALDRKALVAAAASDQIGLPKAAGGNPEGFLFPATYTFDPDVTPVEALTTIVARGAQAYAGLGLTGKNLRAVIIQASIVQAEAGNQKYMGPIARVLYNRLRANHLLQLDSTISYFTGRFGVTTTSKERHTPSPYNTYLNLGLPIGPIGNPGEAAIKAVLKPPPGDWFYFVTVNPDTGETKFANDLATHDKYADEFQAWLAKH